jgi:hypothetical protein
MLRRVVWYKLTDVSDVFNASIIRVMTHLSMGGFVPLGYSYAPPTFTFVYPHPSIVYIT